MMTDETDRGTGWQTALTPAVCNACGRAFLVAPAQRERLCPACARETLEASTLPVPAESPELVIPFALDEAAFAEAIVRFDKSFWFTPRDLTPANLQARAARVYLPMWLVDAQVNGGWQAEVGYDYDVVSHVEQYSDGRWQTTEKTETRIRWESRVGTLLRHYDNVRAPALEDHEQVVTPLGRFQIWDPVPYTSDLVTDALVRVPNRPVNDAWSSAEPTFMTLVERDCQKAAEGQHIRQFKWDVAFENKVWTQLLLPTLMTFYRDDAGEVVPLLINGRSGETIGARRVSWRLVRQTALAIALVAFVLLVAAVWLSSSRQPDAATLLMVGAALAGIATIVPFIYAVNLQRSEDRQNIKL